MKILFYGAGVLGSLYAARLHEAGQDVTILAIRLMMGIPSIPANHAVIAMEYPRGAAAATIAGLITTLCIAVALIPFYAVTGAAIALFLGTAVDSLVLVAIFVQRLKLWKWQDA